METTGQKTDTQKIMAKFDNAGNRTHTYICDTDDQVKAYEAQGFVEITKDDWNTYIGNRADGIKYVRGADGKPTPYITTLDEDKATALNYQYQKYQKLKYAIAWLTDGSGYGFDTDKDSQTDWLAVVTVLQTSGAANGFYKVYTDKSDTAKKAFAPVTLSQLQEAGNVSRAQQTAAYEGFEQIKAEINSCVTKEEVEKYMP